MSVCAHQFIRETFSLDTSLNVLTSLVENGPVKIGLRSTTSSFEMTWTILDLQRTPSRGRCCAIRNPTIAQSYAPSDIHDPRLRTFAADFLQPLGLAAPSRPSSSVSTRTNDSQLSTFTATTGGIKVSSEQKESLRRSFLAFRQQLWEEHGSPSFFSAQMFLSPKQLDSFLQHCPKYLSTQNITSSFLQKLVKWDSAREIDLQKMVSIISDWRESIQPITTPTSQRRARKKTRPLQSPGRTPHQARIAPPVFMPMPPRSRPVLPQPFARPVMSNTPDVFRGAQTPRSTTSYSPMHSGPTPTPQLPVYIPTSTPMIYNPYQHYHTIPPLTYHATPPLAPIPRDPYTPPLTPPPHNPYRYHLTTPIHYPLAPARAYPYPPLVHFPTCLACRKFSTATKGS